jgi:hypothetical protein
MYETGSPFTVADLAPSAKPNLSGFTYIVSYLPRMDPQETCWSPVEFASSISGTSATVAEAMAHLAEHVARVSAGFAVVSAVVHANNMITAKDGLVQRLSR